MHGAVLSVRTVVIRAIVREMRVVDRVLVSSLRTVGTGARTAASPAVVLSRSMRSWATGRAHARRRELGMSIVVGSVTLEAWMSIRTLLFQGICGGLLYMLRTNRILQWHWDV